MECTETDVEITCVGPPRGRAGAARGHSDQIGVNSAMTSASRSTNVSAKSFSHSKGRLAFAEALEKEGYLVSEEVRRMLFHRTAGRPHLALAILGVTGTHGIKDLMSGHAVTVALARELDSHFNDERGAVLKYAASCASLLETVTPASLIAAITAYESVTGCPIPVDATETSDLRGQAPTRPLRPEPEQLILDLVAEGLLVPARGSQSPRMHAEGWRIPPAIAQGLSVHVPTGTDRQKLLNTLLACVVQDDSLCGEQLVQARRAHRWDVLTNLLAARYTEILTRWQPQARTALARLPRKIEGKFTLLRFIRLHLNYLSRRSEVFSGDMQAGFYEILTSLSEAVPDVVLEARSLRHDFLDSLQNANETAVTAGYVLVALYSQGKFDDALDLGVRAGARIDELAASGSPLTAQAAEVFHYHRGVTLGLRGELASAAAEFNAVPLRTQEAGVSRPLMQKAVDYSTLIWAYISGHKGPESSTPIPRESVPAAYTRALRAMDVLDLATAEDIFTQREDAIAHTNLWPLLASVEHSWILLQGKRSRWSRRMDDFYRRRPAHLRTRGLGRASYLRLLCDVMLSTGRLQQVRKIVDNEDPEAYPSLCVAAARMWLIAGEYQRAIQVEEQHSYSLEMSLRDRADLKFVAAAALLALDEHVRAEEELQAAGDLCAIAGTVLPLVMLSVRHRARVLERLDAHPMWGQIAAKHSPLGGAQPGLDAGELKLRVKSTRVVFPDAAIVVELTHREMEVLRLLQRDYTLQQIAEQEHRALSTVKKQAQAVYRKLQVTSRKEATQRAQEMGILL